MPPRRANCPVPLHLVAPGVPRPNQKVGEPLRLTDLAHMELAAAGGEDRGGHGPLEQALHGGHQHRTVPPVEPGQNFQALVLPLAGGGPG